MKYLILIISLFLVTGCFFDESGYVENPYVENICDDDIDNDEDGFVDCEDQDCCSSQECEASPICDQVDAHQQ